MDRRDDTATIIQKKQPKLPMLEPEEVCYDTEDDGSEQQGSGTAATAAVNPGESSPTASAASVSSVGPTLALLQRHHHHRGEGTNAHWYDLTPITSNSYNHTTTDDFSTGSLAARTASRDGVVLVSPPKGYDEDEDRDRLALPNNDDMAGLNHHGMPPMRVTRAQSFTSNVDIGVPVLEVGESVSLHALPFPARTKFFSFSNREQYQDAATVTVTEQPPYYSQQHYYRHQVHNDLATTTLRPYQRPYPDDAMEDLPAEGLSQIFAQRRNFEDKPHRLSSLEAPRMSAYERQESDGGSTLPSLHLAHRLSNNTDNNSIATQTTLNTLGDGDEDDDFFTGAVRETPWSTSSLEPPPCEDHDAEAQSPSHRRQSSETTERSVEFEGCLDDEIPLLQDDDEPSLNTDTETIMAVDGRLLREQEALEWLQSLQLESSIAEAASSKFLRSGTPSSSPARKSMMMQTLGGP